MDKPHTRYPIGIEDFGEIKTGGPPDNHRLADRTAVRPLPRLINTINHPTKNKNK